MGGPEKGHAVKIFIIDDSSFSRKVLGDAVRAVRPDAEIVPCVDGLDALEKFKAGPPDAATIDMVMPKMNGLELIEKLREIGVSSRLVVVTADIQSSTRERCAALHVNDFVEKPITAEKIRTAFQKIFGSP